jgi:type I restriction enzyme R subunit
VGLYKATVALVRAFANLGDELAAAGYAPDEIVRIKKEVKHFVDLRETIRKASGETLDLKAYEADMRHLIDTYIEAAEPRTISPFAGMSLLELIVKTGIGNAIAAQPEGIKGNKDAIAETIENNVRSKIIKSHLNNPAFYEKMSQLLHEIIVARKSKAIEYEHYLLTIADLVRRVEAGYGADTPKTLNSPGKRALYDNLGQDEGLALRIDEVISKNRPEGWRGFLPKEQKIKELLHGELHDIEEVERVFRIIFEQKEY